MTGQKIDQRVGLKNVDKEIVRLRQELRLLEILERILFALKPIDDMALELLKRSEKNEK